MVLRSTLRSLVEPAVVVLRDCDAEPLRSVYDLEAEFEAILRHAQCIALFYRFGVSISLQSAASAISALWSTNREARRAHWSVLRLAILKGKTSELKIRVSDWPKFLTS
jgi:hypothetical protein